VKAVQELSAQNETDNASAVSLQEQIDGLGAQNETLISLQKQIDELKALINNK
jgi:hypothetical protein